MILAHFQSEGNEPEVIDKLNSLVRLGAIEEAVCLSMRADTPSIKTSRLDSIQGAKQLHDLFLCAKYGSRTVFRINWGRIIEWKE